MFPLCMCPQPCALLAGCPGRRISCLLGAGHESNSPAATSILFLDCNAQTLGFFPSCYGPVGCLIWLKHVGAGRTESAAHKGHKRQKPWPVVGGWPETLLAGKVSHRLCPEPPPTRSLCPIIRLCSPFFPKSFHSVF